MRMTREPTAELAEGNSRLKELLTLPSARMVYEPWGDPFRAWRVFSQLSWSLDGTTDAATAVAAECPICEAPSMVEALARAHRISEDKKALLGFREDLMRGKTLTAPPLSAEEKRDEDALRARMAIQRERAEEGMRKHLRNDLKRRGLLEQAKKFHSKTGLMPKFFEKMGDIFDMGRR